MAGAKIGKKGRQTVFFTAVKTMNEQRRDQPYDVKEPRVVPYRTRWKVYQNAVYWINLKSAQDRGLEFWQKNSNAIILDDSVPADWLEKVVSHQSGEILNQKIRLSTAIEGYSQMCLASSTPEQWRTCCGSSGDNNRSIFKT